MGEEVELAAESAGAVAALVETLGLDRPSRALAAWLQAWLHPRSMIGSTGVCRCSGRADGRVCLGRRPKPLLAATARSRTTAGDGQACVRRCSAVESIIYVQYAAAQTLRAARKIEQAGVPVATVADRRIREILEAGALQEDRGLRELWDNLLANALTGAPGAERSAFPRILRELEPVEAATLHLIASRTDFSTFRTFRMPAADARAATGIEADGLENLVRVGVLRYVRQTPTTWNSIDDVSAVITGVMLTDFGWSFLGACRGPGA